MSEDVLAAVSERATAIFSSHKHRVSGQLEPSQGPYALALVGAMLGLNQKQLGEARGKMRSGGCDWLGWTTGMGSGRRGGLRDGRVHPAATSRMKSVA